MPPEGRQQFVGRLTEARLTEWPSCGGSGMSEVSEVSCQVVTTVDSHSAAQELARGAVEARLAACAQLVGPIESVYRWQGDISAAPEWQVVFKTTTDRYAELEAHLSAEHGYEVPEILCIPISAGAPAYLGWLSAETRPA